MTTTVDNNNNNNKNTSSKPSQCFLCSTTDPHTILHQFRYNGAYRRLCTNCVLLNSHGHFCPFCFTLYNPHPPPPPQRATCITCPSIAHVSCATSQGINAIPFKCPRCLDSGFRYFKGGKKSDGVVDERSGRALVCAAMFAAESMNRVAAAARVEAEKRVKEAVLAKKRAKEALERVAVLVRMREAVEGEKECVVDDDAGAVGVRGSRGKSTEGMSKNVGSPGKRLRLGNGNKGT